MHKSVRVKNPDAITLRDCFGATALSTVNGLCTVQYVYAVYDRLRRAGRYGGDLGYIASSVCADL